MGVLAEVIIKQGLGTIMQAIYDRRPVTDPHILCMALGDAFTDSAPLQVTQFEASVEPLTNQVRKLYLEGNGGGNGGESYALAWLFAASKTKCDAFKRGRKGFLFTIGDEAPHRTVTREQAERFAGVSVEADLDARSLLDSLKDDWQVFHLIVETSSTKEQNAVKKWRELLGERAVVRVGHRAAARGDRVAHPGGRRGQPRGDRARAGTRTRPRPSAGSSTRSSRGSRTGRSRPRGKSRARHRRHRGELRGRGQGPARGLPGGPGPGRNRRRPVQRRGSGRAHGRHPGRPPTCSTTSAPGPWPGPGPS